MEKIKELFRVMNQRGIPFPTLRDPVTGTASVTLTMMFIAFNIVVVGLVGKWSRALGEIDISQAMYLLLTTSGLYLGRKMQGNGKEITIEEGKKNNE